MNKPVIFLWALLTLGLPAMLLYSAVRTYRALDDQKAVYLRSRVAAVAARLETLPPGRTADQVVESLEEEPGLIDVAVVQRPADAGQGPLAALWEGRELFQTESITVQGEPVFRAYIPFHDERGLCLARIDMAERTADFLVEHARHHLWFVALAGLVFIALSLFTAWSVQRTANAERRQLELEHLAHIGEMSAVLAHEIRNPLGTIKGFAQLLAERHKTQDSDLVAPILSETSRLEGLVKDLLLYGRPAQPSFQSVDSRRLAETLRAHAVQGSNQTDFEVSAQAVTFETDPNLLEQALLNLLRNAFEAVHEQPGGKVRLESERFSGGLRWRVLDNGPGLSEEARLRLFEPFYTSKAFGTGLGLSITRKVVEALGGEFTIGSRPEGGTVAEIRLPGKGN